MVIVFLYIYFRKDVEAEYVMEAFYSFVLMYKLKLPQVSEVPR